MRKKLPKVDYDERWKHIIGELSTQFIDYFLPTLYQVIELSKPVTSLDKEFSQIFPDYGKRGKLYPDKLLQAHLKNGKETRIFVHVEIQGNARPRFKKRVFDYLMPIRNKYPDIDFTVVVIYIGQEVPTNPGIYHYQFHGTEIIYRFNTLVVKEQKEAELLASQNPFALAVLASLYSLKTKGKTEDVLQTRLQYKKKLAKICYQRQYSKQEVINLLTFVAYAISLPEFLDNEFEESVAKLSIKNNMTLYERNPSMANTIWQSFFVESIEEVMEDLKRRVDAEMEVKKAKMEAEMKAKKAEMEAEIEIEKAEMEAEMKAKKAEMEAKIKAEKAEMEAKIEIEKAEMEAKIKAEKAKMEAKIKAEKSIETNKLLTTSVLKFYQLGIRPKQIAEDLEVDLKTVNNILKGKK